MTLIDVMEIVVWLEISVIGMLFAIQNTKAKQYLSVFYGLTLVSHALLFQFTPYFHHKDILFYVLGSGLDLAVIAYTIRMVDISRLVSDIQDVSIVSAMFNIIGLGLAYYGIAPVSYMALYALLYGYAIYAMARPEPKEDGYIELDNRFFTFNWNVHKWDLLHNLIEKKK
jgi:hypothetical protein